MYSDIREVLIVRMDLVTDHLSTTNYCRKLKYLLTVRSTSEIFIHLDYFYSLY